MKPAVIQETIENPDDVLTEEASEALFESGYTGAPTENPPPDSQPPVVSEPEVAAAPKEEPATVVPPTDAQLQEVLAKVKSVDEMKSAIEKLRGDAFGKLGGLERILKQLQESTTGQAIEVTAADLSELETEFPGLNLGPSLAKGLTRVLSKVKGPAGKMLTPEEVTAQIDERLKHEALVREEERKKEAVERLSEEHEDWQTVIGPPDSTTEFRTWLKGLGEERETAFLSSWNPRYVSKVLSEFKVSKKPSNVPPTPPTQPVNGSGKDARQQRLAEAVPAKGGGLPPAKSRKTEEEAAFEEGFSGGR